ncbi:hypothetical protein ABZ345_46875 [Lentzea sp. NPDC005914]|uniref:hypothetical protein n=1 Tax=Lentzea sp. NPDC005914 TaxID=3154572 RepID=UPI0033EA4196
MSDKNYRTFAALLVALLLGGAGCGVLRDGTTAPAPPDDGTGLDGNRPPSTGGPPVRDAGLLIGDWQPSDSTAAKSFTGNDGACEGFFYDRGAVLNGSITCVISSQADSNGRFVLQVTRNPDKASYKVEFDSSDQATVYSSDGVEMYRISRF